MPTYFTTDSMSCWPIEMFELSGGKNSLASYFRRIQFSFSSLVEVGTGRERRLFEERLQGNGSYLASLDPSCCSPTPSSPSCCRLRALLLSCRAATHPTLATEPWKCASLGYDGLQSIRCRTKSPNSTTPTRVLKVKKRTQGDSKTKCKHKVVRITHLVNHNQRKSRCRAPAFGGSASVAQRRWSSAILASSFRCPAAI